MLNVQFLIKMCESGSFEIFLNRLENFADLLRSKTTRSHFRETFKKFQRAVAEGLKFPESGQQECLTSLFSEAYINVNGIPVRNDSPAVGWAFQDTRAVKEGEKNAEPTKNSVVKCFNFDSSHTVSSHSCDWRSFLSRLHPGMFSILLKYKIIKTDLSCPHPTPKVGVRFRDTSEKALEFLRKYGLEKALSTYGHTLPALLCALVVSGQKLELTQEEQDAMEVFLFNHRYLPFVEVIIQAGFQCQPLDDPFPRRYEKYFTKFEEFLDRTWQPRSLKRLAANTALQNFRTYDALDGIILLMCREEIPVAVELASYIVFEFLSVDELKKIMAEYEVAVKERPSSVPFDD